MDLAELTRERPPTRAASSIAIRTRIDCSMIFPEGHPVPIETLPPLPLWNKWPVLLLFLGLLTGEWLLRKRKGML